MPQIKPPEKILFIDDEVYILDSFRRQLRGKFSLETAVGAEEGIEKIKQNGPYAVVVSDLKMPGMDGVECLARISDLAPDTVRIMLTGFADVDSAVKAINEGNIFRFLTKPCEPQTLAKALVGGIKQYRLVMAERELLEKTLQGGIKVLTDLLAILNPEAFGRAARVTHYLKQIVKVMEIEQTWEFEAAAMLSQIGCVTLPAELVRRVAKGKPLDLQSQKLFIQHPKLAAELISSIPRLDQVAEIIAYQEKLFDGSGVPEDDIAGMDIPLGARVLKVVLDFDTLVFSGKSRGKSLAELKRRRGYYDPNILYVLEEILGEESKYDLKEVAVIDLEDHMILAEDIVASAEDEKMLLAKGQPLSNTLILSVRNYHRAFGVKEPLKVMVPLEPRP